MCADAKKGSQGDLIQSRAVASIRKGPKGVRQLGDLWTHLDQLVICEIVTEKMHRLMFEVNSEIVPMQATTALDQ